MKLNQNKLNFATLSWRSPLLMQWTAPIQRRLGAKVQCRMTGRECLLLAMNGPDSS
jgi:hypothetical protein